MTSLPEILQNLRIASIDETSDEYRIQVREQTYILAKQAFENYLQLREKLFLDGETCIYSASFYEKALQIQSTDPLHFSSARIFRTRIDSIGARIDDDLILGEEGQPQVLIQRNPSDAFILYMLEKVPKFQREFRPMHSSVRFKQESPFGQLFRSIYTISIRGLNFHKADIALEKFHEIQSASLFNIGYVSDVAVVERRAWDKGIFRSRRRSSEKLDFPKRVYKPELIAYYHLALSTKNRLLQYLAYYQILEYFFVSASESVLEKRLADMMAIPGFSDSRPADIRKLIKSVRRFDKETKEDRMLRTVLERYFSPDEIIDFIIDYEQQEGVHFSIETSALGFAHKLNLHLNEVMNSLSQRIYKTRNVLVHNKEDELPRFVPFSSQDEHLEHEIPLVRFLAEQLIIKTGDDMKNRTASFSS